MRDKHLRTWLFSALLIWYLLGSANMDLVFRLDSVWSLEGKEDKILFTSIPIHWEHFIKKTLTYYLKRKLNPQKKVLWTSGNYQSSKHLPSLCAMAWISYGSILLFEEMEIQRNLNNLQFSSFSESGFCRFELATFRVWELVIQIYEEKIGAP